MLPRKERLSRAEFNRFFSVGRRFHTPQCAVVYSPYKELHVSVVVSKKIAAHAVTRNKIRRRMYDIVRNYHREERLTGVYIFLTKEGIESATYEMLREEVRGILRHITQKPK